jgi:PD-(D/E)XK nuclease superfamily
VSASPLIPRLAPLEELTHDFVAAGRWTLPQDHLSPSSLGMLHRCPYQYQRRYVFGEKERPGQALVIGSAVHLGLEHNYRQKITSGEDLDMVDLIDWFYSVGWPNTLSEQQERAGMDIVWDEDTGEEGAYKIAQACAVGHITVAGPAIQPLEVEGAVEADFGIPVKVIGRYDIRTERRLIDMKTGKVTTTKPKPEWRLQAGTYQNMTDLPVEFHSVAASRKTGNVSVATPKTHPELELLLSRSQRENVITMIKGLAALAQHYMDAYGVEQPWPTTGWMHPWACGYCGWRPICPAWSSV